MPESAPVKILIRTPTWLGDMVISSGFVRAVLEAFPESQLDLIVKSGFEKIPLPQRGQIIPFDPKKETAGNFGKTLRAENYDYFYVLPPSFSAAWMAYKSKIPHRIGYSGEFRSFLLSLAKKPGYPTLTTLTQRVPEFIGTRAFYRKISSAARNNS